MGKRVHYHFYFLRDPRDGIIKYVGRTVNPAPRLRHHIYEAKKRNTNKRERWINKILSLGMEPELEVFYQLTCTIDEAIETEKMLVKKLSKRFPLKNSADNYLGAVLTGKVVYQYDKETLSLIGCFANSNQAYIKTGVKDCNILRCCNNENGYGTKSAGGFLWSFNRYEKYPHKYTPWSENSKAVLQFNLQGEFLNEYSSAREAHKETGVDYRMISDVCRGNCNSAKGFLWKFK